MLERIGLDVSVWNLGFLLGVGGWARLPGQALVAFGGGGFIDRHTADMFVLFRGVGQVEHMAFRPLLGGILFCFCNNSKRVG